MSAAPGRDTSIRAYQAKRDFTITAEPPPTKAAPLRTDAPIFVVQKHAARRAGLHWDFRLEHGGVLWSWAVRRGPSLDPADRRAAARVEDHPLDYAGFQGTIPDGQYGAGTVETWDRGTWEPIGDPEAGMRKGELTFVLRGTRLSGRFHLVRLKPRPGRRSGQDGWLLFKGRDGFAHAGADAAAIEASTPALGAGRVHPAVLLGLRKDEEARDVVRDPPDSEARRPRIVTARAPKAAGTERLGAVTLTHPDRELWPGITKRDLAAYWRSVADHALPGLARRPLAVVRCPDGIAGERFFQKHGQGHLPTQIRAAEVADAPYLAIDDIDGLYACAQIAAIELHAWGAAEADPLRPDQIVMDLDPGEGVPFEAVVRAAQDMRARLAGLGLEGFPRTTGGKGLHVVAPLAPRAGWDEVRAFCHALAETMSQAEPERFLSTVRKTDRRGRILIDWLRNDLGATAIASFCPRARPGATVATPLSWREVTPRLDPAQFTMRTLPRRLARLRNDPWEGFEAARRPLPDTPAE